MTVTWQTARFADVLTIVNGRNQRAVQSANGEYPIYGSGGVMGYATEYLCEGETTIIGRKGSINSPIFVDRPFWNVDTAFGLSPGPSLDARFLYRFCQMYDFRAHNKGTTLPSLVKKDLLEIRIPLPPLVEQKRVLGILDEAFNGIAVATENAETNLQNARSVFGSELQFVFVNRGQEWQDSRRSLAELCDLIVDCEHKTAPTRADGIPSIRTPNIGKGRLLLDGVNRVSEETYKAWTRRAVPRAGDLVLAREAPAGNVAVIPVDTPICLGQRTVLIRPRADTFEPMFLALLLLSPDTQKSLLAHSRGATVAHANMKDIRALQVGAIPSLEVQRNIVSRLANVRTETDRLESIYRRKLAVLDELKQSLLHQAFSGNL